MTEIIAEIPKEEPKEKVYSETAFKEVVKQRDELKGYKTKVEEYEQMIKDAQDEKLKEDGELKTLLENRDKELAEERKAKADALEFKTKYEGLDKSIRDELFEELTDELKEVAAELSTENLKKFVKLNKKETPGTENGRPGGKVKIKIDGKKWDDFNSKDKEILKQSDPDAYSQLFEKKYGVKPS